MKKFKAAALGLLVMGSVLLTGCFNTEESDFSKCATGEYSVHDERCSTGSK